MDFGVLKRAVAKQFEHMQKHPLFRANVGKDALWATYMESFPVGSNEIYRVRAEHDCTCCKQFIRAIGDAVALIDGKGVSIWDVSIPEEPAYQVVANALSTLVKSAKVGDVFLHYEAKAGTDKNFEEHVEGRKTWQHFFVNINAKHVMKKSDIATSLGASRALHDVLLRSLTEITDDAVDTVLELIANGLYRGTEQKFAVDEFRKLKTKFNRLTSDVAKDAFAWTESKDAAGSVAKIRGTAIGTLLIDLSADVDLDTAVRKWEAVMAPHNYKRPTALITKAMIEKAKETIADLGLTSALQRRFATINDITINNIMWANRDARAVINGDVFDELSAATSDKVKTLDRIEEVPIARFISEILPKATSLEVMFENGQTGNLVSLIAPEDATAGNLFKWPNNFSWSYNGEVTDSVKERVKRAGGSVEGDLCCRLAWDYADDLDFHMTEPNHYKIYFGTKRRLSSNGGMLDIDANGGDGQKEEPAENIFYADRKKMQEGIYTLEVNNYNRRSDGAGFEVEIEFDGTTHRIYYDKVLRSSSTVQVAKIKYSKAKGFEIIESLPSSQSTKSVWSIPTQTFHKVNVMMLSPNHWDSKAVGNLHYFFMLDGCINDGGTRGFYNEFLKEELNVHRKVFEVVASKMKVADSTNQLSGLGFSSTQPNALVVRVKGSFTRIIKVIF